MSPRQESGWPARIHQRALDLAALRLDEPLGASDASWLDEHLAACDVCRAAASGYAEDRAALRALRAAAIEPPRDLWARTAAAIESEAARRPLRPAPEPQSSRTFAARLRGAFLAPLAAVVVIAVVVGAGLLNGTALLPTVPNGMPTPIAMTAGDVQVLSRAADGSVQLLSRPVNAVCPVGTADCGITRGFDVTSVNGVGVSASLNAVFSPKRDQLVVVAAGGGKPGVYVLPVATPIATAVPTPSSSGSGASSSAQSGSPVVGPSGTPGGTVPVITASPDVAPTPSSSPSSASATPGQPTASPSISVSPQPGGAIEIASDVVVVGQATYSPDGTRVAFSARPADGSAGPDVYVWKAGEPTALALTKDHDARFASWTTAGILVSRVVGATPHTSLLDPATGVETPVAIGPAWLPVVDPTGKVGAWWAGTLRRGGTGDWVPDRGSLVIGRWPASAGAGALLPTPSPRLATPDATATPDASGQSQSGSPAASALQSGAPASPAEDATSAPSKTPHAAKTAAPSPRASSGSTATPGAGASTPPIGAPDGLQVLATGALAAWSIRWDETGSVVAVWTLGADASGANPVASSGAVPDASGGLDTPGASSSPVAATGGPADSASGAAPDPSVVQLSSGDAETSAGPTGSAVQPSPADTAAAGSPAPSPTGRLSLYRADITTGLVDVQHPMLAAAPADGGFSLRSGRLAWTSHGDSGDELLSVLAWDGPTIGGLELHAVHGATIVP